MIASPWNIVLTVVFVCTAAICIVDLVASRAPSRARGTALSDSDVVHIGHAVMSIAMIAMVWRTQSNVLLWAQVALFVVLGAALLPALSRTSDMRSRIDTVSHLVLQAAMVWMLAAMPLLMAGTMSASGTAHEGHGGDDGSGAMLMETPLWASVINWAWVVVSGLAAAWWLYRLVTANTGHRLHAACHLAMGVGMAAMLVLM